MAGCSQPGPAATVTVPQYQAPKPSAPGAPQLVSRNCTSGGYADITVSWSAAQNARSYKVYHAGGELLGTTSGTQFTIRGVNTYPPYGAYYTLHVEACNDAGCTQGPSNQIFISPCALPAPSQPGAPLKADQRCSGGGYASVQIAWSAAQGAKYYRIVHTGGQYGPWTSNSNSLWITGINTWPPDGAYLTLYVEACNDAGCTAGPSNKLYISLC